MKVLLHVCCGPCALVPARELARAGHAATGWFYNPNIQPLAEYVRRREGACRMAEACGIDLLFPVDIPEYGAEAWLRAALDFPDGRCAYCRESRFAAVAAKAAALGFDAFSSSLLYSRRQPHEKMKEAGEKAARRYGVSFLYQDFRSFWQEGIAASKDLGLYRQQWCGCLFSEEERYAKDLAAAVNSRAGQTRAVSL
ncbi:MAG: epoxyqueuosine reductase QueH [Deltaproteobacteria bacterium]|nr:epoxyqueuosine reductase QueH [Deltaproteobacteria bacterium]